jgi:uncharacterized membrane protein YkvA (DUF1232 family)
MAESVPANLRAWAKIIKRDVRALFLAIRDPRTPRLPKVMAVCTVAYALSPIDLIPDFIPVLGYLDDIIILPLAILLIVKLIPPPLMAEFRAGAAQVEPSSGLAKIGTAMIAGLWLVGAAIMVWWVLKLVRPSN